MENFDFFSWVVLPLLIILARIADQTLGTLRLVYLSKGYKNIAPILGFFEVMIWIIAVSQILQQLNNFYYYFAYAFGFAIGNYIGLRVEEKISIGKILVRIFPKEQIEEVTKSLSEAGYGLTIMDAKGSRGPVKIIFSIIKRKNLPEFLEIIKKYNEHTFYTVEDIRTSADGVFPVTEYKRRRIAGLRKYK